MNPQEGKRLETFVKPAEGPYVTGRELFRGEGKKGGGAVARAENLLKRKKRNESGAARGSGGGPKCHTAEASVSSEGSGYEPRQLAAGSGAGRVIKKGGKSDAMRGEERKWNRYVGEILCSQGRVPGETLDQKLGRKGDTEGSGPGATSKLQK